MVTLRFRPESDRPELVAAAEEYRGLWEADGERIVACLKWISGLRFAEAAIDALVYEGISQSHPLRLRASYPRDVKVGTLIHELCHRLVADNAASFAPGRVGSVPPLESHTLINLILFDAWADLYGVEFAERQVAVESRRRAFYAEAWEWALGLDRATRAATFRSALRALPSG